MQQLSRKQYRKYKSAAISDSADLRCRMRGNERLEIFVRESS
jgi:hypothetical protein